MDVTSLEDVILRAQRKEPEAFEALIDAYSRRLYGYLYRLTGSRQAAEDLLQDVFVRVVRTIDQYTHDGRFDGWIFRIATNLVRDRVRKARRRSAVQNESSISETDGEVALILANVADGRGERPDEAMDRTEQIDRMQQAIAELPDGEREVICLRHFGQMSFKEIAEEMGTPLGTALARAHRGLARLRERMET